MIEIRNLTLSRINLRYDMYDKWSVLVIRVKWNDNFGAQIFYEVKCLDMKPESYF